MATYQRFDELDDRLVDELLAGRFGVDRSDYAVSAFVTTLREASSTPPAVVRPQLTAIFETGLVPSDGEAAVIDHQTTNRSRRRRMLEALSAFVATLTGKVVLGSAAVAAGVGGVHAAGVVDVPGLPDRPPAAVVDAPAVDGTEEQSGGGVDVETGGPDDPGVDGGEVSERATSGEPREDGRSFGSSVAEDAVEGTPAEGLPGNRGDVAQDLRPDVPAGGADTADRNRPDTIPAGGADTGDEHRPDDGPAGSPDTGDEHRPDDGPAGGPDTSDEHRPGDRP